MAQIAELQAGASDIAPEHEAEHRPNADQTGEKSEYAPVDAQEGLGRVDPPQMAADTLQGAHSHPVSAQISLATGWRRWWRRIMGHGG
jgi:hypothetical protein